MGECLRDNLKSNRATKSKCCVPRGHGCLYLLGVKRMILVPQGIEPKKVHSGNFYSVELIKK